MKVSWRPQRRRCCPRSASSRCTAAGEDEERKFERQSSSARDAFLRTARLDAVFSFFVAVLESLGIAIVILVGARLVTSGSLSAGTLVAFILLIQNMFKPIRRIIKQWNKVASVYASVERVAELLDLRPTVVDTPDAVRGASAPRRDRVPGRQLRLPVAVRRRPRGGGCTAGTASR